MGKNNGYVRVGSHTVKGSDGCRYLVMSFNTMLKCIIQTKIRQMVVFSSFFEQITKSTINCKTLLNSNKNHIFKGFQYRKKVYETSMVYIFKTTLMKA